MLAISLRHAALGGVCLTVLLFANSATAGAISFPLTIDFQADANGNLLANGQAITTPPAGNTDIDTDLPGGNTGSLPTGDGSQIVAVSSLFEISTTGLDHVGAAIFDSTPFFGVGNAANGPNTEIIGNNQDSVADPDLLVDLGNILILQEDNDISGADVVEEPGSIETRRFLRPDDDDGAGTILFSFFNPVELESIDLIDLNGGAAATLTLTDSSGGVRIFDVPEQFTFDLEEFLSFSEQNGTFIDDDALGDGDPSNDGAEGFATLLFDELALNSGERVSPATINPNSDADFDLTRVASLSVFFHGNNSSAALDNLVIVSVVPEPTSILLISFASLGVLRRRKS